MSSLIGTYGHGTENDFVLVFDPDDSNNLSSRVCAAINFLQESNSLYVVRAVVAGDKFATAMFDSNGSTSATSATGISQNYIHRVILVDSGKDETNVLQGIGRGIRLDGETNKCHIIDISANTLYAIEHRKERKKIYKREKFNFSPVEQRVKVS